MIAIEVPWTDRWRGSEFSIKLSRYCKEQGLVDGVDYQWEFRPLYNVTTFYFADHAASYATLFMLKWGGNEV